MGGIGYHIAFVHPPASDARDTLLRDTWEMIAQRIRSLARRKGTRDITGFYLGMQASDGLADGSWFANEHEMRFGFGDAAGLCYGEMNACRHWTELVVLEMWDTLVERAAALGATLEKPEKTLTEALETSALPLFMLGSKVAIAAMDSAPADAHEIRIFDTVMPLSKVPTKDRARVRELVSTGRCACDICQALRAKLELPLAPEPARAPERKAAKPKPGAPKSNATTAEGRYDLANAPVYGLADTKKLLAAPQEAVAVDLGAPWLRNKVPPALRRALPNMPIRALGLSKQKMHELWHEVYAMRDLEVLSLYRCGLARGLGPDVARLSKLRGIDVGYNSSSATWDPALYELTALEMTLGLGGDTMPEALAKSQSLRFLDAGSWRRRGPSAARDLPLEGLVYGDWIFSSEDIARMPLRYLETGALELPESHGLEALVWNGAVPPRWIAGLPKLRALYLDVETLPHWLPELHTVEALFVRTHAATDIARLRPLEAMKNLRFLALFAGDTEALPLDFSALEELETLVVNTGPKAWKDMPRGIASLAKLKRFIGWVGDEQERAKMRKAVPNTTTNGNVVRTWEPFAALGAFAARGSLHRLLARFKTEEWLDDLGFA